MRHITRRSKSRDDECCAGCGCHSVKEGQCEECSKWDKILDEHEDNQRKGRG